MAKEQKKSGAQEEGEHEGPRSFGVFLQKLPGAEGELSREMHDLTKVMFTEARLTGVDLKGELSLKLKFTVSHEKGAPSLVAYEVSTKKPKRKTAKGYFWGTEGGNLTPDNPVQKSLDFREVNAPKARDAVEETERGPAREA